MVLQLVSFSCCAEKSGFVQWQQRYEFKISEEKKNSNAPLNLKPQFQPLSLDKSKRALSDRRRQSNNSNNRVRIWTWKQRKRESQVSQVNMELERKLESIKRMKKLWN